MKKNKLYTANKWNQPLFTHKFAYGGDEAYIDRLASKYYGADYGFNGNDMNSYLDTKNSLGISKRNNPFSKVNIGNTIGGLGSTIGGVAGNAIRGGFDDGGVGSGIQNVGGQIGDAISTINPLVGGIVSIGSGLVGGLFSRMFGVKENKENTNFIKQNTSNAINAGNVLASSSDNMSLVNNSSKMVGGSGFHWGDLYQNGWFTSKGTRLGNNLIAKENTGLAIQNNGLATGADNIDTNMDRNALRNFAAFGGPIGYFGTGALGIMQNDKYLDAINNRSDAIAKSSPFNASYNGLAFGGELGTNGTDFTNGLLYVDEGGSHEENPLGGIPMGVDDQGIPNLVEEDETVFNDYVFSNRMKVPKAFYNELGLGGALNRKGITFAEASKKLAKESEQRPNDPISQDGLEDSMNRLAAIQEAERMKKQMEEYVGLQNTYAEGGPLNITEDDRSLLKKLFGENRFTEGFENTTEFLNDPVNYIFGDQIEAGMSKLAEMSEPQLEKFFRTSIGQQVANAIVNSEGVEHNSQEAGVNRWYKATGRMARPIQRSVANAAKRALAQSKNVARGQMKTTPKGAGRMRVKNPESPVGTAKRTSGSYWEQNTQLPAVRQPSEVATLGQRGLAPIGATSVSVPNATGVSRVISPFTTVPPTGFDWRWPLGTGAAVAGSMLYDYLNQDNSDVDAITGESIPSNQQTAETVPVTKNPTDNPTDNTGRGQVQPLDVPELPENRVANPFSSNPFETLEEKVKHTPVIPLPSEATVEGRPQQPQDLYATSMAIGNTRPYPTWMRYAPAVGSGIMSLSDMLGLTNTPDYTEAQKIEDAADRAANFLPATFTPNGDYLRYDPMDIWSAINRQNANSRATDRTLSNSSNPAKMAGILANSYNNQIATGDLFAKGLEYNNANRARTADFNRRTNMFNSQMGLEAAMANSRIRQQAEATRLSGIAQAAAMRDSIDTRMGAARSANLSNFLNSLGNIGRENFIMNQINDDDAWRYGVDNNGYTPLKRKRGSKINKK